MTWPTLTSATPSGNLSSTEWNYHIEALNHLGAMRIGANSLSTLTAGTALVGVGFRAFEATSNQSISAGVPAKVTFDSVEFDTNGAWSNANDRFTVPAGMGGYYRVSFYMYMTGTLGGSDYAEIQIGGTNRMRLPMGSLVSGTIDMSLAAADTLELWISTAAATTVNKTLYRASLSVMKVG